MGKKTKKDKKDVEAWLLSFEEAAGRPVVVSLLIEDGEIDFMSAVRKNIWTGSDIESDGDADDGEPDVDFQTIRKKAAMPDHYSYIG